MTHKHIPIIRQSVRAIGSCCLVVAGLAACGGGGGDRVDAPIGHSDGALTIAGAVGNYTTGCARTDAGSDYKLIGGVFTDAGGGKGRAVVRYQTFGKDATCAAASLAVDLTATLEVVPVEGHKSIAQGGIIDTARIAQVTLVGLSTSGTGGWTASLPAWGTTARVGYLLQSPNLRLLTGARDSDGLGHVISTVLLKKL